MLENRINNAVSSVQNDNQKPFAEVIESSISSWQAQTWDWKISPKFGSILTSTLIDNGQTIKIFGIVYFIKTGSTDQSRSVYPFGKTNEELLEEYPQVFEFLSTSFSCITLGYLQNNKIYYHLAPKPVKLHTFVQEATQEELREFFSSTQFLQIIFSMSYQLNAIDELLIAMLKNISDKNLLTKKLLIDFINTFSLLTSHEYTRLKLLLQRIEILIDQAA